MREVKSPGATAIRETLIPDMERIEHVASRLTQPQGRALALAYNAGTVSVSNKWSPRTVPAAVYRSLCELGLFETVSTGFGERTRLSRDGSALVKAVIRGDA